QNCYPQKCGLGFAIAEQTRGRSDRDISSQHEQQASRDTCSPSLRVSVCSGCAKSPQHYYRREKFDCAVSTECEQSGTPRPPRGEEGHDSLHTHPCDCDGLHPVDSPDSVWIRDLQHRSHSRHYVTVLACFAVKDLPHMPCAANRSPNSSATDAAAARTSIAPPRASYSS